MSALELKNKYQSLLNKYEINTPLRLSHFFTQLHHESSGFSILKENLNYSVDGLLKTFGRHRISNIQALQFGRTKTRAANQEAIANIIYGGDWGKKNLGNTNKGDGWKFVGRGFKQLTGRGNYSNLSKDTGIDYINNPEWLEREVDAMISACWFWKKNNCNFFADKNDIIGLTKKINGGLLGLKERKKWFNTYKNLMK